MENRTPTIHDIAKALNISASTVSRALNGHPSISEKTIKRIKSAAESLGYKPNSLATNLRKGKSNTIGLIVPRINRSFFSDTISGIEKITTPAGYNLIICQSNERLKHEEENILTLVKSRVDGIILSVTNETINADHFRIAQKSSIPLVLFDRVVEECNVSKVVNDNLDAAYNVVRHLIDQGYKKIAHFAGNLNNNIYRERLEGYKKAIVESCLELNSNFIFNQTITIKEGQLAAKKILKMTNMPDAIFSSGDYAALGALLVFKEENIKVPQDIGIAGFANESFTEFLSPSITTVNQFGEKVGMEAAKLIIDQINNKGKQGAVINKKIVPSELCIRNSSKKYI